MFIYVWESVGAGEEQRERETEYPKQAPAVSKPRQGMGGVELKNPESMTWAEAVQSINWQEFSFFFFIYLGKQARIKPFLKMFIPRLYYFHN